MQAGENNCVFCKIVAGKIPDYRIWEDQDFVAFLDIKPVQVGHVLIIPRAHYEHILDLPDDLYTKIFLAAKRLAPKIGKVVGAVRMGLSVVGIDVTHAHLHLIPIHRSGDMNFDKAKASNPEALKELQRRLSQI